MSARINFPAALAVTTYNLVTWTSGISKKSAYVAILAMGIVSILGDTVYEWGRGIAPTTCDRRGIFNATMGLGTLASGVIFGALMSQRYPPAVLVGFVLQISAVAMLLGKR